MEPVLTALVVGCNPKVIERHSSLIPKGYKVHTADNGEDAMKIMQSHGHDISVVLAEDLNCKVDKGMMSGLDLANKVNDYDIPTIMLPCACGSFGKDKTSELSFETRGNTYFLNRTPTPEEMGGLLKEICAAYRA